MHIYVLELESCIKIGCSSSIENRINSYSNVLSRTVFDVDLSASECGYVECRIVSKFNSPTEYIYNESYKDVLDYVDNVIKSSGFSIVTIKALNLDIKMSDDGYVFIGPILEMVNRFRASKGKGQILFSAYARQKNIAEFMSLVGKERGLKPSITKTGKHGSTYVLPLIAVDFLLWSDVAIKVKMLSWLFKNKDSAKALIHQRKALEK